MKYWFRGLLWSALLIFMVMWLSSYTHHTSIGIDHDQRLANHVIKWFHRINWNGHGSLWIGYGTTVKQPYIPGQTLEHYDPAAVFFQPTKPITFRQSFWNRLGFWYITGNEQRKMLWLGIPAWLPVLLILLIIRLTKRPARG